MNNRQRCALHRNADFQRWLDHTMMESDFVSDFEIEDETLTVTLLHRAATSPAGDTVVFEAALHPSGHIITSTMTASDRLALPRIMVPTPISFTFQ